MTLKDLLKREGFTQREFGERLGVVQTAVSNWCNGANRPSISKIREMAKVLGVSLEELLDAMEETQKMEIKIPLEMSGEFSREIRETIQYLYRRAQEKLGRVTDANPNSVVIQATEQRIADLLLIELLRDLKNDCSRRVRENIGYVLKREDLTLYRAFQIKETTFWLDTDVTALLKGVYKVFLYKGIEEEKADIIGAEKIPAILFVGDYRYFDCFDDSEYVLMAYPGCYFTSTAGRSWTKRAVADKKINQIIEDCKFEGCDM